MPVPWPAFYFTMVQAAVSNISCGSDEQTGCYHGTNGSILTKSETLFDGPLQLGYVHGKATIQFADDTSYEGNVTANVICGPGVMLFSGSQYHGDMKYGIFHGKGTLTISSSSPGSTYQGKFSCSTSATLPEHYRLHKAQKLCKGPHPHLRPY